MKKQDNPGGALILRKNVLSVAQKQLNSIKIKAKMENVDGFQLLGIAQNVDIHIMQLLKH